MTEEDFWSKVDMSGECWTWTGKRTDKGYGIASIKGIVGTGAHRIAYILTHGSIEQGLCVCHRCDNPPCVRPDHMFLGTHLENMQDKVAKGRSGVRRPSKPLAPRRLPPESPVEVVQTISNRRTYHFRSIGNKDVFCGRVAPFELLERDQVFDYIFCCQRCLRQYRARYVTHIQKSERALW